MKTKITIIAILASFIFLSANAQIKFGIRAGINSSKILADDFIDPIDPSDPLNVSVDNNFRTGFHFGLGAQIQLFKMYIQPELLFTSNRNDLILRGIDTTLLEQKFNKLNIPILVGAKFGIFKIGIGPVATIMLNSKSELVSEGFSQKFKTASWGYQVGIGLDISKISLDLKYEGNLGKFGDNIKIGDNTFNFDQRQRQIIFSIGLYLF